MRFRDEAPNSTAVASRPARPCASAWLRRIVTGSRVGRYKPSGAVREAALRRAATSEGLDMRARVRLLPELLDARTLPNGVVELVIEDVDTPVRELFDVREGRVCAIEPGSAVPWASIVGPSRAWASALGPKRDPGGLRLVGDAHLARSVLAAMP